MTFTPGPWKVSDYYQPGENDVLNCGGYRVAAADSTQVKEGSPDDVHPLSDPLWHREISIEEQEANAALIAAAPDMYEALKAAERFLAGAGIGGVVMRTGIRAALAKAEGR